MSKKVILYIACSLDGFIARKNHDISWLFMDQSYGFEEFEKSFDTAVMGRKTYDYAVQFSNPPFAGRLNFVVTSQRSMYPDSDSDTIFCSLDDVMEYVRKKSGGKGVFLAGGAGLIASFINAGLLNEIVIAFHPIILGEGIPLFEGIKKELNLKLIDKDIFHNGLVKLKYEII